MKYHKAREPKVETDPTDCVKRMTSARYQRDAARGAGGLTGEQSARDRDSLRSACTGRMLQIRFL